jgi:hypothetical protein
MYTTYKIYIEELDGPVGKALGVGSRKLSTVRIGESSDGWLRFTISNFSMLRKAR